MKLPLNKMKYEMYKRVVCQNIYGERKKPLTKKCTQPNKIPRAYMMINSSLPSEKATLQLLNVTKERET